VEQIKAANRWQKAYYDDSLLKVLGLLPDHNAIVEGRTEAPKTETRAESRG
jgi:hypothetical protein